MSATAASPMSGSRITGASRGISVRVLGQRSTTSAGISASPISLVATASPASTPAIHGRPRCAARNEVAANARKSPSEYAAVKTNAVGYSANMRTVSRAASSPITDRAIWCSAHAPTAAPASEMRTPATRFDPNAQPTT